MKFIVVRTPSGCCSTLTRPAFLSPFSYKPTCSVPISFTLPKWDYSLNWKRRHLIGIPCEFNSFRYKYSTEGSVVAETVFDFVLLKWEETVILEKQLKYKKFSQFWKIMFDKKQNSKFWIFSVHLLFFEHLMPLIIIILGLFHHFLMSNYHYIHNTRWPVFNIVLI